MRPLFTVHAGEFVVGSEIERRFPRAALWVPSKDTGIDLLVTTPQIHRPVSLQIKSSRDYATNEPGFLALGWWTLDRAKIEKSRADFWVFVMFPVVRKVSAENTGIQYVIIPPRDLAARLVRIHGRAKRFQSYLAVTRRKTCWEARGLTTNEKSSIAHVEHPTIAQTRYRDFTVYLNAWALLAHRMRR